MIAHDTTDISNHYQIVVLFRYIVSSKVAERFWSFCDMPQGDAETISSNVLNCLKSILLRSHDKQKLVAQCYDDASVMSGQHRGVQSIIKEACSLCSLLCSMSSQETSPSHLVLQQKDDDAKKKMKKYTDKKSRAKKFPIKVGDSVLLRQAK